MARRQTPALDEALDRWVDAGGRRAWPLGVDFHEMWSALGRCSSGGKRVRPELLLTAHRCYGGGDHDVVVRVAAALELLHTAFVIHDDVIDRDLVRRGSHNVSGTFVERAAERGASADGCLTAGVAAGVLAGDLALAGAVRGIALCGANRPMTERLLDLLDHSIAVTAAGELDDVLLSVCESHDVAVEDIVTMQQHKTAVYSFQLPLQAGALLAGAPEDAQEPLGAVGRLMGIGFQLVDDLRGVFGEESTTGKSALGDLREGKLTTLIVHARSTVAWPHIAPHVGDQELTENTARVVRDLLEESGSREFVARLAQDHLDQGLRTARESGLPAELVTELTLLSAEILESVA
ncbi:MULTISPECIES: polyprenyl synthetase family protein [unclassified Knoellia]|uniref:polyprenyl synthetase family protein n=1 Tax=Knoellia altitudinis TaxID=3404795 RepID=UPI00360FF592